ncbi:Uncharacterised protein [Actinomyces viscosus]|uniref:Uncharacterized protein n=1 Tax=Actinomyces viscosus TaxID=1656 RepID=A0A448PPR9_ACTVI|nr:Uncharacterised protein [Actinomyces viscosus]
MHSMGVELSCSTHGSTHYTPTLVHRSGNRGSVRVP